MILDKDLSSIQEARDMVGRAKTAYDAFLGASSEDIDKILRSMVQTIVENAEYLARMTVEETNYGIVEHKVIKNLFASRDVYEAIKNIKTTGILREDRENNLIEAATPVGVVLGIVPTTNPTSTIIHNTLCAVKAGNAIVFSPHPKAVKSSATTAALLHDAAVKAGAPVGLVGCLSQSTMEASHELMHHPDISVIVATGGSAMVKAAYSAGKPALGVGPGNVPAFIERSADVRQAVKDIITSKSFDNGMICASEQSIIADAPIKEQIVEELKRQGGYFLSPEETKKVSSFVMTARCGMNPKWVGQTAVSIAAQAGISVPSSTKILIAPLDGYGAEYPLSHEKLTTVLAFYTVNDWEEACHLSIELLKLGGIGHTFSIHSKDDAIIRKFLQKPVSRIVVNTPSALGGIGYSTGLLPSLTLGCGTWGGSSLSENLGPQHFTNIKRLAYGIKEVCLAETAAPKKAAINAFNSDDVAGVVRQVLKQLQLQ